VISSVEIATDSELIICGSTYGSIGILDREKVNSITGKKGDYKTILRSHTGTVN
jgi:hypothetical protein